MFLIIGVRQEQTELDFDQALVCPVCGRFGHLRVVMVCTCLRLFFLPILHWGRRYYATMGCCGAACELDPALGRRIARGETAALDPDALQFSGGQGRRRCRRCGFETAEDFEFCPKCGTRF